MAADISPSCVPGFVHGSGALKEALAVVVVSLIAGLLCWCYPGFIGPHATP